MGGMRGSHHGNTGPVGPVVACTAVPFTCGFSVGLATKQPTPHTESDIWTHVLCCIPLLSTPLGMGRLRAHMLCVFFGRVWVSERLPVASKFSPGTWLWRCMSLCGCGRTCVRCCTEVTAYASMPWAGHGGCPERARDCDAVSCAVPIPRYPVPWFGVCSLSV